MSETLDTCNERMQKSIEALKNELNQIRTGRASASLFDRVRVEYYGDRCPLNQVATVQIPEARMVVINPCDDVEAKKAVMAAYEHNGPVYMRFGRLAVPVVNDEDYEFEIGKGVLLREGTDVTIIATGLEVSEALEAHELLKAEGISARVINIHTIKPLDEEIIVKAAEETGAIVTAEEHSVIGGLGEAVCGVVADKCPVPVVMFGVKDKFGFSGPAAKLIPLFELDAASIAKAAKEAIAKKK